MNDIIKKYDPVNTVFSKNGQHVSIALKSVAIVNGQEMELNIPPHNKAFSYILYDNEGQVIGVNLEFENQIAEYVGNADIARSLTMLFEAQNA